MKVFYKTVFFREREREKYTAFILILWLVQLALSTFVSDFAMRLHCIVKVSQCFCTLVFPSSE
jgi:hypothetical protein